MTPLRGAAPRPWAPRRWRNWINLQVICKQQPSNKTRSLARSVYNVCLSRFGMGGVAFVSVLYRLK